MAVEHVDGKDKGTVMLYALSTCGWCRMTRELLTSLGVEFSFVYVDLLTGEERRQVEGDILKHNRGFSFPTLVINGSKVIIGFREDEIREALA
ncbi:MAG TPA: glutaredoxin family protein [Methanocella sp.]|nr:glutaredoxin family protein [Methanocella sp.]